MVVMVSPKTRENSINYLFLLDFSFVQTAVEPDPELRDNLWIKPEAG